MAKKLLKDKLVNRNEIKEELRPIKNTKNAYCTPSGLFYADYGNDMFYPLRTEINSTSKYCYVGLRYNNKNHNTRKKAHRIIAETYIPNPNKCKTVRHKNNIRHDNRVEN